MPSVLHEPRQVGDWQLADCTRAGCDNSPFTWLLVGLPEKWVKVDVDDDDGRVREHSHRSRIEVSGEEPVGLGTALWELKERVKSRLLR